MIAAKQISSESKVNLLERCVLIGLGTLLLCLGVSGVSLWIDEGYSVQLADQASLTAWAHTLSSMRGSEPQMPGYLLYLWAGAGFWNQRMGFAFGERALGSCFYSFAGVGSGIGSKYSKSMADHLPVAVFVVLYERGATLCNGDGPLHDHDHCSSCICRGPATFPTRAMVGHGIST